MTTADHDKPTSRQLGYAYESISTSSLVANSIQTLCLVARASIADRTHFLPDNLYTPLASNLRSATFIDMSTKAATIISHAQKSKDLIYVIYGANAPFNRIKVIPTDSSIERIWGRYNEQNNRQRVLEFTNCLEIDSKRNSKGVLNTPQVHQINFLGVC
ncbi:hypothetical protein BT69DRAFT_1339842 [Atractiella rhizophila]|nr:hypothetical protein BT69DRAFT_1339842 [Atractiella rhizophila]